MFTRMSIIRPWKQNMMANYFPYFINLKNIFYRYRSTGKSSKNIPVLLAYLHCNEGVLWVYFSFTYQIGPKYGNGFGWFTSAPVPIELTNYAIEIWKIVRHDDLVPRPDNGHPNVYQWEQAMPMQTSRYLPFLCRCMPIDFCNQDFGLEKVKCHQNDEKQEMKQVGPQISYL